MEVINTIGRRKTSVARIYLKESNEGNSHMIVNGRDYKLYFPTPLLQFTVNQPLETVNAAGKYDIYAIIDGGGFKGQAEALSLAISRALVKIDAEHRPPLKSKGLLMRDPRMVERKKPGQKKARKRFQFSKR
ncbi:MAG TPA: 30S ribosomal protein S9 [Bacteroidales bacterium]|nr:30S ribosomal protein S9 [Bacteroidales bacterium]HSA43403.1 30S ribosomal protein S9 [Bacteroidales bacterium]